MMSRNFILFVIVAVIVGRMSLSLNGPSGVARGDTTTPVFQDNFDDNKKGSAWKLFGQTAKAKSTEVNKRLEFTATSDVNVPFAGYISDKWWIDPNQDFQMKIDLYFNMYSYSDGWICFGLTPNSDKPGDRYATLGIGCSGAYENYWREWQDGYETRMDFQGRTRIGVTLYIFYDSWYDILYLGDSGYDPDGAWQVLPNIIRGSWGRVPLYVFLAMKTEGLPITAGTVYLDNFVIEKGRLGSPYTDPNSGGGGGGGGQVQDVTATVGIVPTVIRQTSSNDKITALIGLPTEVTMADYDSTKAPTLSPGGIAANAQAAFVWVDGEVKILASFSKTALLAALTTKGENELFISGQLKDGRTYAGSTKVTIE